MSPGKGVVVVPCVTARVAAVRSWVHHPVALVVGVSLVAIVLLIGLTGVAAHQAGLTVQADAQRRLRSNCDAAVRALASQGVELEHEVAALAVNAPVIESLRAPTPAALDAARDQLSTLTRSTDARAAFVTDAQGVTVAVYPAQPELIGQNFSFRDWFQGVSRTAEPYVSEAYRSAATGNPLVVGVAAPVLDGARPVGSVTVLWQLDSVRAVSDGALDDDGVTLLVTDQRGRPLASTLAVDQSGQALPVDTSATTRQALAGHSVSTVADGMFEEAAPVPGIGWTVTARLPSSVALAPARTFQRNLYTTLGAALLFVLAVTLLAGWFARRRAAEQAAMHAAEAGLRASEDRFRRLFDEALTGKLLVDGHGDVIRVNSAVTRLLGRAPDQLTGTPLAAIFDDDPDQQRVLELIGAGRGELRAEMAVGGIVGRSLLCLIALSWMRELDGTRVLLAQVEDITDRRDAEQQLLELTLHDELTGLPNRRLMLERCHHAFAVARSGRAAGTSVAAFFIDLDGFKPINDSAGHEAGDRLLVSVADDLRAAVRPADTVARVGGDEFVVLIDQDDGPEHLRTIAERITTAVRRQVPAGDAVLAVSASIGTARIDLFREPDARPDELLRRADAAMYRAKERGGDRHEVFEADLGDRSAPRGVLGQPVRDWP